jgi:hypothetical protein
MSSEENILKKYRKDLKDNFPFFRMFLKDDVSSGDINHSELTKVYDGLYDAYLRLMEMYPYKTAKSVDDVLKLSRTKSKHSCEFFHQHIVFRVSQVLLDLLTNTSTLISNQNEL